MSNEREAFEAAWEEFQDKDLTSSNRIQAHAWFLKGYRSASQSAGANESTLRVLSSHAIRKHEGVTIFGDPAQVLKVMAAIESAGATGQEAMGALDMLRLAHKTLAWAALTQIRDGERIWNEIGAFLDAATDQEPVGIIERDEINGWHMNALIDWEKIGLGTKLYAAPIGDNGAAHVRMATRTASGPELHAALVSQPAESKRVELTDEEIGHLRLIVAFCETLSSIEIGSYAYDALCALRLFLARASAKGE